MKMGNCCSKPEPKKKIVYKCSVCADECPVKEFDKEPKNPPVCCGKTMKKVQLKKES